MVGFVFQSAEFSSSLDDRLASLLLIVDSGSEFVDFVVLCLCENSVESILSVRVHPGHKPSPTVPSPYG